MNDLTNNNGKRKEEILEKSRESNEDEGVEYTYNEGSFIGRTVLFFLVFFPLLIISFLAGKLDTILALGAVSCSFWFGDAFSKYRFTKKKIYLIKSFCTAVLLITFMIWFIASVLGG